MRLPRPNIPLSVRVKVAERQLWARCITVYSPPDGETMQSLLDRMLSALRGTLDADRLQLDHDPALALRAFNKRTGKYTPDANDPAYLKYRPTDDHRTKTFIRGEHGQRSDRSQIKRERRRLRPKKPKRKIPQRANPWPPKGSRKFQSRRSNP